MPAPSATSDRPSPIGFAPPYIDEDTIAAVERVLRSGWITTGPETAAFEKDLARFVEAPHVVCGGSWTGLAGVVLDWFGVGPGDEVILPAYTYCATANVVLHRGATPVLIDLPENGHRDGFNITWAQVAPLLSPRTKVVMPVDIGGWPVPCQTWKAALTDWAKECGFEGDHPMQKALGRPLLLSDAAHSLGGRSGAHPVGACADMTLFSFHAVKNLTTAEGGAAALSLPPPLDNGDVYRTLRSHCLHGQSKDAASKYNSTGKGQWRYDVTHPGFKCNMTDIQAAMGRVALKRYPEDLAYRTQLADRYEQRLSGLSAVELPQRNSTDRTTADHLFIIQLQGDMVALRDDIMEALASEDIATNVHFPPIPMLSAYAERGFKVSDCPEAMSTFDRAISLPLHRHMTLDDVDRVVDTLTRAMAQLRDRTAP